MRWPTDRKFVDKDGKILDHWRYPIGLLEQLLNLSPTDFATLQTLITAAQSAEEGDDPFSLSAAIAALAVDEEPDLSADYLVEYDVSESTAKRVAMSSLQSGNVLISTTVLSGSSVDVAVPTGFRDVEFRVNNLSMSTTSTPLISFSEDGGSTLLNQLFHIFTETFSQTGNSTAPTFSVTGNLTAPTVVSGVSSIRGYQSLLPKLASDFGLYSTNGVAWVGCRYMGASTGPIDLVRLSSSAGVFDGGNVELIGIP